MQISLLVLVILIIITFRC